MEEVIPLAMKNDVRLYNTRQKLIFITSGLGGYLQVWNSVFHEMLKYVVALFIKLKSLIVVFKTN